MRFFNPLEVLVVLVKCSHIARFLCVEEKNVSPDTSAARVATQSTDVDGKHVLWQLAGFILTEKSGTDWTTWGMVCSF